MKKSAHSIGLGQLSLFSTDNIGQLERLSGALVATKKAILTWLSAGIPKPAIDCATFAPYMPRIVMPNAHPHTITLNEPTSFAEVAPEVPAGSVELEANIADTGALSIAQIDALARINEAFQHRLPNGRRAGFLFGDGTGAGKTRPLLAAARIVMEKTQQPVFVFSLKREMLDDFKNEMAAVKGERGDIVDLGKHPKGSIIPVSPKVYFGTYATLRKRYEDILTSMPADFQGGIFMDEAQNLRRGNEEPLTKRGKTARLRKMRAALEAGKTIDAWAGQSQQARAFIKLDETYPDAHVLMVSATAASSVEELRYMSRLGLWGGGTVFRDYESFVGTIRQAGLSGLELLAQEVAATGRSITRSLSFDGIEYEILRSPLSDEEAERYDKYVAFWDDVAHGLDKALGFVNLQNNAAAGKYKSALTSARRKCLQMAKMRLRLNALIAEAKECIDAGESVVVQVCRTQEAALKAALKERDEDEDDSELDLTGSQLVRKYLGNCFPTSKYVYDYTTEEMVVDIDPVTGAEVKVQKAREIVDQLALAAEELIIDQSPIDTFIDAMGGAEMVAEYTGRKVRRLTNMLGAREVHTRTERDIHNDMEEFRADNKRVLLFSEAKGGAGINMHADARWANKRKRNHYILELGYRADGTIQAMGRTNRNNQVTKPRYILVYADVPADLLSTEHFALKMARLGAVTRGDRKGTNIAFFDPENNLVDEVAQHAFKLLVGNLANATRNSPFWNLAIAVAKRIFDGSFPSDIKTNQIKLETFLREVDRFPIAVQEDFCALFREITERERDTARENGSTFGKVDTLAHQGFMILSEHEISVRDGKPVPDGMPDEPVVRLLAAAYRPKPAIVQWADADARYQRTTLPKGTVGHGQYLDGAMSRYVPAIICGVWISHDGNQMTNILTPYGYRRRRMDDISAISFSSVAQSWQRIVDELSRPRTSVCWIVEKRILALEDVRKNPMLIKVQTSDGRRIFGAMVSEITARGFLAPAVGTIATASVVKAAKLAASTLVFASNDPATDAIAA